MTRLWNWFERILRAIVGGLLKLFKTEPTEKQWAAFMQFVKFCLVGVSNTLISFGIYCVFVLINKKLYLVGNAVGFVVSVLNSYILNSKYVFKKRDERVKTIAKTFTAYGTNLLIGTVLLYLFVDVMRLSEFIAPILNLAVTVPLNFLLNKFWVMKKR